MNNPASGLPESARKSPFAWSILVAFVFFLLCWKLHYPSPAWDDLFYNGAALNMANGGDFSNPLLSRQGFPSHYFFVYPPLHSYAVYWWLSLFGISAASLLAFQNLMYFIIAAAMIVVLRRYGAREFLSWLVPWGVAAVFLKTGLRPEGFGVALTMSGYAALLYCRKVGVRMWISFFLIFMGSMAAPRTGFFGAALALLVAWQWLKCLPPGGFAWLRFFLVPGSALAATALVFLVLIGFRFAEFYQTFHLHSTRLNPGNFALLARTFRELGARWLPILFLTVLVLCLALRRRTGEAGAVAYCLAITFLVAGVAKGLGHGSSWYLVFILLLLTAALSKQISRSWTVVLEIAIALVMLCANGSGLIEQFGIITGKIQCRPPANRAAILALRSTDEHTVIVDSVVARNVFDYRLPAGSINYEFSAPFPGFIPTDTKLRSGDIYVISPGKVSLLNYSIHTAYPLQYWFPFQRKSLSYPKFPCQVFIIPAQECLESMAKNSAAKK